MSNRFLVCLIFPVFGLIGNIFGQSQMGGGQQGSPAGMGYALPPANNGYAKGVPSYGVNQIQLGGRNPRQISPRLMVQNFSLKGKRIMLRSGQLTVLSGSAGGIQQGGGGQQGGGQG